MEVPRPILEELTVQNDSETHAWPSNHRATMMGPRSTDTCSGRGRQKASGRVLTAEQEFTARQEAGRARPTHASVLPPPTLTHRPPPEPWRQMHLVQGPAPASPLQHRYLASPASGLLAKLDEVDSGGQKEHF